MAYDPCNPVPTNTIPSGLPLHPHHAVHHVVGRIKSRIHHKFVHLGPPAAAPNPYGCEKHAIAGPGAGHGLPAAPLTKLAALGGAGAGLVALGGIGGIVGGLIPGTPGTTSCTTTKNGVLTNCKVSITPPGVTPVSTNPAPGTPLPPTVPTPPNTIVPPVGPTVPGTPPTQVPEPSTLVVFVFAVMVALAARHFHYRRLSKVAVASA